MLKRMAATQTCKHTQPRLWQIMPAEFSAEFAPTSRISSNEQNFSPWAKCLAAVDKFSSGSTPQQHLRECFLHSRLLYTKSENALCKISGKRLLYFYINIHTCIYIYIYIYNWLCMRNVCLWNIQHLVPNIDFLVSTPAPSAWDVASYFCIPLFCFVLSHPTLYSSHLCLVGIIVSCGLLV